MVCVPPLPVAVAAGLHAVVALCLRLVLLLLGLGLVMLWSASYAQSEYDTGYTISTKYLQKQGLCAGIGLLCMWAFSRIPAKLWLKLAWPVYALSIVLLLCVLLLGESVNGARRWINIAGIQFQPSEIAKFAMILLFALCAAGGVSVRLFLNGKQEDKKEEDRE